MSKNSSTSLLSEISTIVNPNSWKICKRDYFAKFDSKKISNALSKAGDATGEFDERRAQQLTLKVLAILQQLSIDTHSVEQIQDVVEEVLLSTPYKKTAKAYIIYREQTMLCVN